MQAIQITDGRTSLWQWDTGVRIKVYGCTDVDQMHFVTTGGIISRELVNGECGVPDTALQTAGLLMMYAYDRTENGGVTRCDFLLMVKARPKPADYIDPPDEYDNLSELAKRVAPLIPGGGGSVTPEQIQQAVDNYLAENPVQVEETDPTVPGWAKAEQKPTYTAEEVGALPADTEIVDQTARDGVATLSKEIAGVEPHADDIPRIYFGASIPQNKNETVMKFRYASRTLDFDGYCETKAQGNSSMAYPKKNQTTKLFDDLACKTKHKIDFKGWGKQNKFCLKANWIDLTHARNIVSARLWGDVVKSRAGFDELPELMRTSPNYGAVDGFPVRAFANGKYQGRYTINIPKDKWMANMDDENPNHCILCGENYVSGCFRAEAKIDGSDWSDEVHDVVPDNIKTRWNQVISFVMNSTDEEFVNNLDNYIDVESTIDYYIFGLAVCNLDGFGKNQLFLTYDGVRWYASAYDMDSTFGLYPDANGFISTNYPRESYEDFINSTGNLLYVRLANLFSERIIARWEQLRHDVLSANHIIERFESFSEVVPPYMIAEDYAGTTASGAFVNIPLKDSNNIQQIRAYTVARLAYVHEYLTGESAATNLWNLEGKTQRYFAEFKFPTDAITFEDGYYNGANRAGYWEPNTDKHPNLTINGNDFAVANTQSTNAGYGLGVPIDLTPGETYKISYSISGPAIVSLMYYGDDGIYIGRNELNDFKASGECETTFTIPDCKTVIFHAACDAEYDPDNPPVATYSNIEIVQL